MTVSRQDPRANQRRRTRAAIMEGARKLLREGKVPSIADAAEEAAVSRATAYRYFPTQGALISEAVDEVLVRAGAWEERFAGPGGLAERVERYMSQTGGLVRDNEALMRGSLLLSLQQWAKLQAGEDLGEEPIKRGGRLQGIDTALEPFKEQLDAETLRRLAIAISVVVGIESRVVMHDIWDLDDDEAEQMMRWMARAFVKAAEAEDSRSRR
jgi:AcrR family transcriptional regulator